MCAELLVGSRQLKLKHLHRTRDGNMEASGSVERICAVRWCLRSNFSGCSETVMLLWPLAHLSGIN